LPGCGERSVVLAVQRDEDAAEVDSAGDHADRRHDDIVDQRSYDGGEGGADNDADRHVHHVAAERKFLELFKNRHRLQAPFYLTPTACHVWAPIQIGPVKWLILWALPVCDGALT